MSLSTKIMMIGLSILPIKPFLINADEGGKKYWLKELANGLTRYELIQGFIDSQEFESLGATYSIRV